MSQPNNQMIQRNLRFLAILLAGLASIAIFRFTQISLFKTSNGQDLTAYHETGTKRSSITEAMRCFAAIGATRTLSKTLM